MDAIRKLSIINHSALEMMDRIKKLEDKDDRCALLLEMGEWIFIDINLEDELFVPDWENVI